MKTHLAAALALALAIPLAAFAETPTGAGKPEVVPATAAQVLDAVRASKAKVSIVNLWATWCGPCRKEFPDLMRFYRAYKDRGVALFLVSSDFASESDMTKTFLAEQGVDFTSWLKNEKDEEFINGFDPEWGGGLPATFLYDGSGQRRHSFLGTVTYESLEKEVTALLAPQP